MYWIVFTDILNLALNFRLLLLTTPYTILPNTTLYHNNLVHKYSKWSAHTNGGLNGAEPEVTAGETYIATGDDTVAAPEYSVIHKHNLYYNQSPCM